MTTPTHEKDHGTTLLNAPFNPNAKTLFRLNAGQFYLMGGAFLFGVGAGQANPYIVFLGCLFIAFCGRPDIWHGLQQTKIVEWNRK